MKRTIKITEVEFMHYNVNEKNEEFLRCRFIGVLTVAEIKELLDRKGYLVVEISNIIYSSLRVIIDTNIIFSENDEVKKYVKTETMVKEENDNEDN